MRLCRVPLLILAASLAGFVFQTAAEPVRLLGDLNRDGEVTLQDLIRLIAHVQGDRLLSSEEQLVGDLTRNGRIEEEDVHLLARALVGLEDPGEIDLRLQDSDYDGRNDYQELQDSTDPLDPDDVEFTRLGYWRFNTDSMAGEAGGQPLEIRGVERVPSFSGTAARLDPDHPDAVLRYRDVDPNGSARINIRRGAIRFWFRPDWSSGTGPGNIGRLIALGEFTPDASLGYWGLHVNPDGTEIQFLSQADGEQQTHVTAPIDWEADRWYKILLTYSPSFTAVEVDDVRLSQGSGILVFPDVSMREEGWNIGSNRDGTENARGLFNEFETFNYRPGAGIDRYSYDFTLSATVQNSPPKIRLEWKSRPDEPVVINRRPLGASEWTVLESDYTQWSYVDESPVLEDGGRFEYLVHPDPFDFAVGELFDRYILCAIEPPVVHEWGKVLLLVDETVADPLQPELERLRQDLVGDGWDVLQHEVPRHDDEEWANNPPKIQEVKDLVDSEYAEHGSELTAIFIIGHAPIPHSGHLRPDGHHHRPWPVDFYYGDTIREEDDWTDVESHEGSADSLHGIPPDPNEPGDGIFDQDRFPSDIEVAVGRVDFARMPTFTSSPPDGVEPVSEVELLRRYLDKNHRFRHHQLVFPDRVAALGFFGSGLGADPNRLVYSQALKNVSAWFGLNINRIREQNHFKQRDPFLWGFQFGAGFYDEIGVGNPTHSHTTADLADPAQEPDVGFYVLDGSFFGEWDSPDNFMRAALAPPNSGLAALWGRWFKQRWQGMALGEPLGSSVVRTINNLDGHDFVLHVWSQGYNIHIGIMGDPTLRLFVQPPPGPVVGEIQEEGSVLLQWGAAPQPEVSYYVYRSMNGLDGPFIRLNEEPIPLPSYEDEAPPDGSIMYKVRAAREQRTGSGRFTNLSQASFVVVE